MEINRLVLQELNLSGNFISSFQLNEFSLMHLLREQGQDQTLQPAVADNFLAHLISKCQSKSLTLNLAGNQLQAKDIQILFLNSMAKFMKNPKLKIKLLVKDNWINLSEFNCMTYKFHAKLLMFEHFILYILNVIFVSLKNMLIGLKNETKEHTSEQFVDQITQSQISPIKMDMQDQEDGGKVAAEILLRYYLGSDQDK